jgi:hypothetical protein
VTNPAPPPTRAEVLAAVESVLAQRYESRPTRASVSFVGVDPMQVLRFAAGAQSTLITLGMSGAPMTSAAELVQAATGPRAELLVTVRAGWDELWRALAVLGAAPAVEGVVYAPGMSIDTGTPLAPGSRCTGALVTESEIAPVPAGSVSIQILQLLPATSTELGWCRVRGAPALRERWAEQGTDLSDLGRAAVRLD